MAANDYYNSKPLPHPSPQPSHYAYGGPSSYDSPSPPPYSSPHYNRTPARPTPSPSPFETPFDDHVYPSSSYHPTPYQSQQQLGQQDPAYHDLSSVPSDGMAYNHNVDDIPLQTRPPKDSDVNDHVYEAPRRRKPRKVRFGELGMFGADSKRIPWVVYVFTVAQVAVFIGEIVKNATTTGSPIMIHPQFNPMIGPSTYVLINMGARFVPCMHNVQGVQTSPQNISWPCPNTTSNNVDDPSQQCTLSQLCGFGGVPEFYNTDINHHPEPNQWFRFIVPMFLHAGVIHIGFNLLLQLTMGREMEKAIGSIRFFLVYVCSGIFGFVLGGNFAAPFISSTGASGSLFGVIALTLLDLLYSWRDRRNPVKDLMFILLDVLISFVLGLLPGLDNYSHIGGFVMGLALGICVLHSPNALRSRIGEDPPYSSVVGGYGPQGAAPSFFKNPVGFFKGRKPLWWAWWLIRAGALVLVTIFFILLLNNFYVYRKTCHWCKYLSCLPINNWCDIGNLNLQNTTSPNRLARDLFHGLAKLSHE
ncbi:hypothetical protein VTK73DRAFT_2953 [Phialemonium thermophilum]|uniref:Rhomboid-type serine protease n=1 Tax=Phialemonium thermophilum TaxID=223376 RepID=A0ABR3X1Z8_9PEZI